MKRRLTLLVLAAAAATAVTVRRRDPPDDDHAVWAAVLDAHFQDCGTHFVTVADSTYSLETRSAEDEAFLRAGVAYYGSSPAMIESYIARNRRSAPVEPRRMRMAHVHVVAGGGVDRPPAFSDGILGHAVLSRPGYDADRRRALVTLTVTCGAMCGRGETVQADRGADGAWRVTKTFSTIAF